MCRHFYIPWLASIAQVICEQYNPCQGPKARPGVQSVRGTPFENIVVDFIELPWVQSYTYLLVFVCTFSGWVEAFHICMEKAQEVAQFLLKEIIPQFGIPITIGSDNRMAFVVEVV